MDIELKVDESAELEFRKALYKHKFDRNWYNDLTKIENEHYAIMGAIFEFTKADSPDALRFDPLELPKTSLEYKFFVDLPLMKDLSEELMFMLS